MKITDEELRFLSGLIKKEIIVEGNVDTKKYRRLIDAGYVTETAANISTIVYTITDKGKAVLTAMES